MTPLLTGALEEEMGPNGFHNPLGLPEQELAKPCAPSDVQQVEGDPIADTRRRLDALGAIMVAFVSDVEAALNRPASWTDHARLEEIRDSLSRVRSDMMLFLSRDANPNTKG